MTKTFLFATIAFFLGTSVPQAQDEPSATANVSAQLEKSMVGKMVSSVKLQLVDGKNFKEAKLTKVPEYYIIYFSASW